MAMGMAMATVARVAGNEEGMGSKAIANATRMAREQQRQQ